MNWRIVFVVAAVGCAASETERTRQTAERRQARDSVLKTGVVESLKPPASTGRLIYDRPADLSYDSLRLKRSDLVLAADRQNH